MLDRINDHPIIAVREVLGQLEKVKLQFVGAVQRRIHQSYLRNEMDIGHLGKPDRNEDTDSKLFLIHGGVVAV